MNIKLNEKIISDRINLPDEENKVFQGICNVGNFVFVTAYDDNGDNSVIYILDGKKHIKTVTLYNNSHVGGICFDNINNLFWITDKGGYISSYQYDDIFNGIGIPVNTVYVGDRLVNYKDKISVAYVAYNRGRIYVGNFSLRGTGILKEYLVTDNGSINLDSERVIKFLDKVQGITFYDDLLVISTSYGRNNNSLLKICSFSFDKDNYSDEDFISIIMPPMMEQISFDNDRLFTLYEINAKKFNKFMNKNNDILIIDFIKMLENIEY